MGTVPREEAELPPAMLWSFPEPPDPAVPLGEGVSVCTGPATSTQVTGTGKTFSVVIHSQGCEAPGARTALPRVQTGSLSRERQFSSGQNGVNVYKVPAPLSVGSSGGDGRMNYHSHFLGGEAQRGAGLAPVHTAHAQQPCLGPQLGTQRRERAHLCQGVGGPGRLPDPLRLSSSSLTASTFADSLDDGILNKRALGDHLILHPFSRWENEDPEKRRNFPEG